VSTSEDFLKKYPGSIDRLLGCINNRSIDFGSIDFLRMIMRSIDFFTEERIDRLICLGQFFIFLGSASNSENDQIALDVFSSLIQVF
jgi:hypothetical protein